MHLSARAPTWQAPPGNLDPLNFGRVFPSDNAHGIPSLNPQEVAIPSRLIQWGSRPQLLACAPHDRAAVHFFLDDYRFESVWRNPSHNLDALLCVGTVLSPDFSLWRDMPVAMQLWQTYRNRWLACYWQSCGLQVIATVSWSEPFDFCYAGIPRGSVVALSTVGVARDREAVRLFHAGYHAMIEAIEPMCVLCYGSLASVGLSSPIPVVTYPTRWEDGRRKVRGRAA